MKMNFTYQGTLVAAVLIALSGLIGCSRNDSSTSSTSVAGSVASPGKTSIAWLEKYDTALTQAKSEGKPVMVDFFATWCGPCIQMERNTYTDASVAEEMKNWVGVKVDVDKESKLAQEYNVESIPTLVVLNSDGKEVARYSGYMGPEEFKKFARAGHASLAAPSPSK